MSKYLYNINNNILRYDLIYGNVIQKEYKCEILEGNTFCGEYKIISINYNNLLETNK